MTFYDDVVECKSKMWQFILVDRLVHFGVLVTSGTTGSEQSLGILY